MNILYKDRHIVACVKPVGLDSETEFPSLLKETLGGEIYPVHRLDKNVGGVMVYARTKQTAAHLSAAIQNGEFSKEYLAQVHGTPPVSGMWEDLLFKDSKSNKVFVVKKARRGVKQAILRYQVLRPGETSLVHIRLETGRSHQIRVQFSSRKFPLVGDHKYGSRAEITAPRLYSFRIRFPLNGGEKCFQSPPDWFPTELEIPDTFTNYG